IARTPGREKANGTSEQGYLHCGPNGAGHFVKMVHNGIEYGIMAAYAEGLGVLRSANVGKQGHAVDAETTPLRDPEHYQYDLNLPDIAEVWRRGSVIASWLLDLSASALIKDPKLEGFKGRVSDSGEGRWTIKAAISTCRSSAWRRRAGTSSSSRPEPRTASTSTEGSTPRRSVRCAACCATSTVTTRTRRPSRPSARSSVRPSGRRTTWPSRRCCSSWSWSSSTRRAVRVAPASSSRNRSATTSPPRGS